MVTNITNRMVGQESRQAPDCEFVTVSEASKMLGVSRRTVERWVRKSALETWQIAPRHSHRIRKADLPDKW